MTKRDELKTLKRVTIRDVARLADTSIATVSYVLNNESRYLRPELKERVIEAARKLGYVRNAPASSLKGKRLGMLAVLVAQFANAFFTRMCVAIESVARRDGYIITICNSYDDPAQERLIIDRLLAQRIDGCIICPALSLSDNAALLHRHRVPYVILERSVESSFPPHDFVGHDNFQSGYLAAKRLLAAGHRRIAFSGWDSPIPNVRDRVDGYRAALREYGVPSEGEMVLLGELSLQAGRKMAAQLLTADVTAVVLGQHDTAKGTMMYFQEQGVSWPDDVSIVLVGTPEWSGMLRPPLTCIKRPEQELGQAAASRLLDKLKNPDSVPVKRVFPPIVEEGGSVKTLV